MLGKLLKYDMKIQMKMLGVAYAVVGLVAVIAAIFELIGRNFSDVMVIRWANMLTFGLAAVADFVLVAGTFIYMVFRFRKNLFRDEGYLMHTLPVEEWQLYMSKLMTGTLCCILSAILAIMFLCVARLHIPDLKDFMSGVIDGGAPDWVIPATIVMFVVAIPATLTQFYIAIIVGYTIKTKTAYPVNKDFLSVLSYIVLYTIQQVISLGILIIWGGMHVDNVKDGILSNPSLEKQALSMADTFNMMGSIYALSISMLLLTAVVFTALSIQRMNRHLNLN